MMRKPEKRKVAFLDIDGVLNSVDSAIALHGAGVPHTEEHRLDPVSVGLLRMMCSETDAKIVISSTWRFGRTSQDFIDIFALYGWANAPIIGRTARLAGDTVRGDEIQHYLNNFDVDSYVILDDDSDMLESQLNNFVHVSNINGFRSQHYVKCLRILGHPDERLELQVNWTREQQ